MPSARGPFRVLLIRRFAAYWSAQTISSIADQAFWVGLAIKVGVVDGRPGTLALAFAANTAALLALMLFGGALTDRLGARRVVIAGDLVRGVALAGLAAAATGGGTAPWTYVAAAAAMGAGDALFYPAYGVAIVELVGEEAVAAGNALRLAGQVAASTLGSLGALAAGSGAFTLIVWIEAATFFAAAAVAFRVIPLRPSAQPPPADGEARAPLWHEAIGGMRIVLRRSFLRWGVLILGVATLVVDGPKEVGLPLHAADADGLDLGAGGYAWLAAAGGLGAFAGALWWGRREWPAGLRARSLGASHLAWAFGIAGCATDIPVLAVAGMVLAGFGVAGEDVVWYSSVQAVVRHDQLGRVLAVADLVTYAAQPLSFLITAALISGVDPQILLAVAAAGLALTATAIAAGAIRDIDAPAPATQP